MITVFLPEGVPNAGKRRIYTITKFPEDSPAEHVDAHVGWNKKYKVSNAKFTSKIRLSDGTIIELTPEIKAQTLFFIEPDAA